MGSLLLRTHHALALRRMVSLATALHLGFLGNLLFLCSSIGLLEDALVAADLPLQVLLNVCHAFLVVHFGDDRCMAGHAL